MFQPAPSEPGRRCGAEDPTSRCGADELMRAAYEPLAAFVRLAPDFDAAPVVFVEDLFDEDLADDALAAGLSPDVARARVGRLGVVAAAGVSAAGAAVAAGVSLRAVFVSAARALPAAVCGPFALVALDAATRALAALTAAAVPVDFAVRAVWTVPPPSVAATLSASRDLRRAAALGWMAPALAARSRTLIASASASAGLPRSGFVATRTALATSVFAALRRGPLIAALRAS